MKKTYLSVLFCLCVVLAQGQAVINPSVKSKTSFAIVVDDESYKQAKDEVEAYRRAIEDDGLGTYIVSHTWSSPDEIRDILIRFHQDKNSPLEGAVFVGDIPIPMLRDAQHLTSAFKMNQSRSWQESSVASDRFYDDFGLTFDFIKQDSIKPLYFYYSLRSDSEQAIHSDIYSARIKPLEKGKTDKYAQLRSYLKKVVEVRTEEKGNAVDNLTVARGHGYNSESKVAWSGEQLALKEQFKQTFSSGSYVKFMDFDSYWPMKPYWLNEILRPELDILLFHHHGSNDYQYINGYKSGSDVNTSIENIKVYLRSKVAAAVKRGKSKEEAIEDYVNTFGVPREWCEGAFDPALVEKDSIMNVSLDMTVRDILQVAPNVRFVMFDACYNGSFYEDEYIAGAYIFNDGKTIVVQGNTVNAIQDKWPDQFLGLLDCGLRIGQWGKYTQYLETHTIGDPTFRFANNTALKFDINEALTVQVNNVKFWKKALTSEYVDVQAIALRVLYDNEYPEISSLLKKTYFESPSMIVRLEALILLSRINNDDFIEVLTAAAFDSYELTRRFALEFITKNGSEKLLPAVAQSILKDNTSERIIFKIMQGFRMMSLDKLEEELSGQINNQPLYTKEMAEKMLENIKSTNESNKKDFALITDKSVSAKNRKTEISRFRNQPATSEIDTLLAVLLDTEYEPELRFATAETLGWFNYSHRRDYIVERLKEISSSEKDKDVLNELTKTINRLTAK